MMRRLWIVVLAVVALGCAKEGNPAQTMEDYLKARVESDVDEMRQLSCADWESQAILQADSFRAMEAKLDGMSCKEDGKDGEYTLVACEGKIVTTYNGETREWPLGTYKLVQEDEEWKMCGEAE